MTLTREALLALDRRHLWHPFTQMKDYEEGEEPLLITHAKGPWLYDGEQRYLDAVSSMWMGVHGHHHPALNRALVRQLEKAAHTTLLGATHPPAILLAAKLSELAPKGLDRVFFSDNGSTAMEVAVKMAYEVKAREHAAQGKRGEPPHLFLTFEGGYHGDTLGSVSIGGVDLFHAAYGPLLFKTVKLPYPETGKEALSVHLGWLKRCLKKYRKQLVGAVVEPGLQAAGGMRFMLPGYLKALRNALTQEGLLLVADEVATGFYRLGPRFAVMEAGVTPDLMAVGKGMTGGYLPIAATLATERVYKAYLDDYEKARHLFHGHTFTGNPLAASVCLANLDLMEGAGFMKGKQARERAFSVSIHGLAAHPLVGAVRVKGMAGAVDMVKNKKTGEAFTWEERAGHKLAMILRRYEVFMRPLGSTVVLMPPLSLSPAQSKFLAKALRKALNEFAQQEGLM